MTAKPKMQRVPVEKWSCPNHPDGPPTLPADGWEREELTIENAYSAEQVAALMHVVAVARPRAKRATATVEALLGLCCIGHEWKTVGYEMVDVGPFQDLLYSLAPTWAATIPKESVLLSELSAEAEGGIRVPITLNPERSA